MSAVLMPHGVTTLPTLYGSFQCFAFSDVLDGVKKEALALVRGDVAGQRQVVVRPHSQCITSEVFGSLKCDCKDQLHYSIDFISREQRGAIIYVLEEGRGIGLMEKIRAYSMQDQGMNTIDANLAIGQEVDSRLFLLESRIIMSLGIASVQLLTNNPEKADRIAHYGVSVDRILPIPVRANRHSYSYLETKRTLLGHTFPGSSFFDVSPTQQ